MLLKQSPSLLNKGLKCHALFLIVIYNIYIWHTKTSISIIMQLLMCIVDPEIQQATSGCGDGWISFACTIFMSSCLCDKS